MTKSALDKFEDESIRRLIDSVDPERLDLAVYTAISVFSPREIEQLPRLKALLDYAQKVLDKRRMS